MLHTTKMGICMVVVVVNVLLSAITVMQKCANILIHTLNYIHTYKQIYIHVGVSVC